MRRILIGLLALTSLAAAAVVWWRPPAPPEEEPRFPRLALDISDEALADDWEEKVFRGRTQYAAVPAEGGGVRLRAVSEGTASALYRRVNFAIDKRPLLRWAWRILRHPGSFPEGGVPDYAAQVTAVFRGSSILSSDFIQYVWAADPPPEPIFSHPHSDRVKIWVLRTGDGAGEWTEEKRDLYADYTTAFGRVPAKPLGAVAVMTDADNTKTRAAAFYKDIAVEITHGLEPTPNPEDERATP